jgi:hypothetical protein
VAWLGIGLCIRIGQGPWRPPSFYTLLPVDSSVSIEGNVGERIDKSASEAMFSYDIVGLII